MFFVRSLTTPDFKMTAYILNDGVYDKILFNDIIYQLENLGLKILANTNVQGGKNRPLFKALGINTNNVVFINSAGREMVSMYDIVHEVKNLRNGELDDTMYFPEGCFNNEPNGLYIKPREHFEELKTKTNKINDKHINCVSTDRQRVNFAVQLISRSA